MKKRVISLFLVLLLVFPSFSAFAEGETVDLNIIEKIITNIESYYKYDVTREELIEGAYKGIMGVLDKHSKYFTEREYSDFMDSLNSSLIGIGVYVEAQDNYVKVISPIDGTPAFKAGIEAGDIITHVDDVDVTTISFEKAIDMIKGVAGTSVKITVRREGEDKPLIFNIVREQIVIEDVEYEMLADKVGYIQIKQFGLNVSNEFTEAITALKNQGMTSIIVDLRNNPGGYLEEVIEVADWFVEKGDPIVHIDYRTFADEDHYAKTSALNIPTAVLINGGSASASEILAGAIKNNDEGEIVGTLSYGKGTVQNLMDFAGSGAIKLTTAEYLTAGKAVINNVGVTPDYVVELKNEESLDKVKAFAPFSSREVASYGRVSLNIFATQQRLNFIGYNLAVDGSFGPATLRAINDFQVKRKLPVTNTLTLTTKTELDKAVNESFSEDPQLLMAIKLVTN